MENGIISWPHTHKWVAQMYPVNDVPSNFEAIVEKFHKFDEIFSSTTTKEQQKQNQGPNSTNV